MVSLYNYKDSYIKNKNKLFQTRVMRVFQNRKNTIERIQNVERKNFLYNVICIFGKKPADRIVTRFAGFYPKRRENFAKK